MNQNTFMLSMVGIVFLYLVSIILISRFSSLKMARFKSKEFWSFFLGYSFPAVGVSLFISIMSVGGPNIENKNRVFLENFSLFFSGLMFMGMLVSYFMLKPEKWTNRILMGFMSFFMMTFIVSIAWTVISYLVYFIFMSK